MKRAAFVILGLMLWGAAKLPAEHALFLARAPRHPLSIAPREQISHLGIIAAFGGLRSVAADFLFIQAHIAWERTEWSRVLLLFRQVTTFQPRGILFWDVAAWHMAWNASAAALNDPMQPRLALRIKAQREYFDLGRDFLERGIRHNPDRPQLYEALARLYRDKYKDHMRAAEYFDRASEMPGAHSFARRFAAYELSYCEGHEREAYDKLLRLYSSGPHERLPTLIARLKFLEDKLNIPLDLRIPEAAR